ncbi:MAG: serine/threonine-protein kinase [Planctomycetota bacterium]
MTNFHQIAGYDVISTLGKGAGSTLYSARDKHGAPFALKRVTKKTPHDQRYLDQAIAEHQIANKFDHPNLRKSIKVIKLRELIRVSEIVVVMELVDGKTLEEWRPDSMLVTCRICRAVAAALKFMHDQGYVHADIKPNNIMVTTDGQVKIIDFGQSCPRNTVKERIQGTPDYIAPEQVKRQAITEQTDVFCLGATMYWMLTGKNVPTAFTRRAQQNAGVQLKTDDYKKITPPIELNPNVTPALSSLVMDCVQRRPDDRPHGMQVVIERLEMAIAQIERNRRAAMAAAKAKAEQGQPEAAAATGLDDTDTVGGSQRQAS